MKKKGEEKPSCNKLNEELPVRPEEDQWRSDPDKEQFIKECIAKIRNKYHPEPDCLYGPDEDWRLVDLDDLVKYDFIKQEQRAHFGGHKWFVSSRGRLVYMRQNPKKQDEDLVPHLSAVQPRLDNKRIINTFEPPHKSGSANPAVEDSSGGADNDEELGNSTGGPSVKVVSLPRSVLVFFSFVDVGSTRFEDFNRKDYVIDHINEDTEDNNLRNLWILSQNNNKKNRKFRNRNNSSRVGNVVCLGKPKPEEGEDTYIPVGVFRFGVMIPRELAEFDVKLATAEADFEELSPQEKKEFVEEAGERWYELTGTLEEAAWIRFTLEIKAGYWSEFSIGHIYHMLHGRRDWLFLGIDQILGAFSMGGCIDSVDVLKIFSPDTHLGMTCVKDIEIKVVDNAVYTQLRGSSQSGEAGGADQSQAQRTPARRTLARRTQTPGTQTPRTPAASSRTPGQRSSVS
ncbi:hypothetical protein THAOC_15370 [Thalassiosira oceanica]|uniref:Uncharacterized protein n=1 Tax=Thalassiosira oceanica TaxID=159749 RepID=K0SF00_THAOC|nr:hypothetical protein THAOC_15370 [Thalassiosira oceanica]|eukprot:EJK63945.1 hypothetical protein THAOC_15370 [Thalassiosira oceanica]